MFWSVEAVDNSYDILNEIHCKEGHCTGHEMWRYLEKRQLFSFPRELITKFPLYCEECRAAIISKEMKKIENKYQKDTTDLQDIFNGVAKNNICRQGRFFWIKIWTYVTEKDLVQINNYILSQICMESGLILSSYIESIEEKNIVSAIMEIFSHGMCAAQIAIEYPEENEETVPKEEFVSNNDVERPTN